ncbi:hypothetical protein TELCIR_17518, partial [Teladorsagia circumcincta]
KRGTYMSFGGREIKANEYPWIVKYLFSRGKLSHVVCSGALISTRHFLTAAHCVTEYNSTEVNEQCRRKAELRKLKPPFRNKTRMSVFIGKSLHVTAEALALRVVNYVSYREIDAKLGLLMMRENNVSLCTITIIILWMCDNTLIGFVITQ